MPDKLPITRFINDQPIKLSVNSGSIMDGLNLSINGKVVFKRFISFWNMRGHARFKRNGQRMAVAWHWSQRTGKPLSISVVVNGLLVIDYGDDSTRETLQRRGWMTGEAPVATKPSTGQQIFISYRRQDLPFAKALYAGLAEAGYRPWLDLNDIRSGEPFQAAIDTAIRDSHAMIVLASPWSVGVRYGSQYVLEEWTTALRRDPQRVLALLVQDLSAEDVAFIEQQVVARAMPNHADGWQAIQWYDMRVAPERVAEAATAWVSGEAPTQTGRFPTDQRLPPIVQRVLKVMIVDSMALALLCVAALVVLIGFLPRPEPAEDYDGWVRVARAAQIWMLLAIASVAGLMIRDEGVRFRKRGFPRPVDSMGLLLSMAWYVTLIFWLPFLGGWMMIVGDYTPAVALVNPIDVGLGVVTYLYLVWVEAHIKPTKKSAALEIWTPVYPASAFGELRLYENTTRDDGPSPFMGRPAQAVAFLNHADDQPLADFMRRELGISPTEAEPDTLIILMSRALMDDPAAFLEYQHFIQREGEIVVPVQIEACTVWRDLNPANWIDAIIDIEQALDRVRPLLRGERMDTPIEDLRAPLRQSGMLVIPFGDMGLMSSIAAPVVKMVLAIGGFFVGALAVTPSALEWLAFVLLYGLGWGQLVAVTLTVGRRIAFNTLLMVYLGAGALAVLPLLLLQDLIGVIFVPIPWQWVILLMLAGDGWIAYRWQQSHTLQHWLPLRSDVRKSRQGFEIQIWVYVPLAILAIFTLTYVALVV